MEEPKKKWPGAQLLLTSDFCSAKPDIILPPIIFFNYQHQLSMPIKSPAKCPEGSSTLIWPIMNGHLVADIFRYIFPSCLVALLNCLVAIY